MLEERAFPVLELRAFASEESEGKEIEFEGEPARIERPVATRVVDADLVFCAAPHVLEALLPEIRASDARLIDVSGQLELDPEVPLYLPGADPSPALGPIVAVPRGVAAGVALALRPVQTETTIHALSVVTFESASGAGRRGVGELSDQTVSLLNAMTGEAGEAELFPQPLAFDCLPLVGDEILEGGDSSEERRLGHVLRRLLRASHLQVEATRVRVPIFGGSLACVHASLDRPVTSARLHAIWEKEPGLRILDPPDLPTPRTCTGHDDVAIGRVRAGQNPPRLAFVLALDDLRRGAALACVEVAERLTRH